MLSKVAIEGGDNTGISKPASRRTKGPVSASMPPDTLYNTLPLRSISRLEPLGVGGKEQENFSEIAVLAEASHGRMNACQERVEETVSWLDTCERCSLQLLGIAKLRSSLFRKNDHGLTVLWWLCSSTDRWLRMYPLKRLEDTMSCHTERLIRTFAFGRRPSITKDRLRLELLRCLHSSVGTICNREISGLKN